MRNASRFLALLVVLAGVLPVVAVAPGGPVGAAAAQSRVVPDAGTDIQVQLWADNRSARWTIETRYELASDNETAAFQQFERRYEAGEVTGAMTVSMFESAAAAAETATGREMAIEDVERTARLANRTGVVRLAFTWRSFVVDDENETLRVGDAFETPGNGTWLATLGERQRVVVHAPPGYVVNSNPGFPQPNSSVVVVQGPWTADSGPQLAFSYRPTETSQGVPVELLWTAGGIAVALAALVVGFAVFRRRETGEDGATVPEPGDGTGSSVDDTGGPTGGSASDRGAAGADGDPDAAGETSTTGSEEGAADVDVSLLSDEEQVEHLLQERGGRMKQATIVKETGWSDAKVSQLLSSMAEEGRVNKLRLGRENLISLPDEDGGEDGTDEQ